MVCGTERRTITERQGRKQGPFRERGSHIYGGRRRLVASEPTTYKRSDLLPTTSLCGRGDGLRGRNDGVALGVSLNNWIGVNKYEGELVFTYWFYYYL